MFTELLIIAGTTVACVTQDSIETKPVTEPMYSDSANVKVAIKNQFSLWGTARVIKREDISKLPVRGVQSYILLNPGVVEQDGDLHVRGGRSDEIGYMIEGISTRSVLTGQTYTTVIPEALEELQFQPGVYSARYGLANSGLINQDFRTGDSVFHATLSTETDNFTPQNEKRLGTYSYGYSNYVLTLSGPVIDNRVRLFVAMENRFDRDFGVQFIEGFSASNLRNSYSVTDTIVPLLELKPGNMPGQMRNRYTANGTLAFDVDLLKLRLTGAFTSQRQQGTMLPVENIFNLRRQPITEASDLFLKLAASHELTRNVSLLANVFYGDNRSKTFDPDHGDDYMMYEDSLSNADHGYPSRSMSQPPDLLGLYGFEFNAYGANATRHEKGISTRIGGTVSATVNLGIHSITAGGSFEQHRLRYFATDSKMLANIRSNPGFPGDPNFNHWFGSFNRVDNYGYDVYGNESNEGVDRSKSPMFSSLFLEDAVRLNDVSIGIGLRYDIMDFDDFEFIDDPTTPGVVEGPANPSIEPLFALYRETGIAFTKAQTFFSPRVSINFDPTERWRLYVSYGRFAQPPAFSTLYFGRYAFARQFARGSFIPTATHFEPVNTKQFEVGADFSIPDFINVGLVAFYKEVIDQVHVTLISTTTNSGASSYLQFDNGDRATAKGIEFTSSLQPHRRLKLGLSYTLSEVVGSGSGPFSAFGESSDPRANIQYGISRLSFSHAHLLVLNADFRFDNNDGAIPKNAGVNLLVRYSSGHPYTSSVQTGGFSGLPQDAGIDPRFSRSIEPPNESTSPSSMVIDLRINKSIDFAGMRMDFFVYVQNVFNKMNELNVYRTTGQADDNGFLTNTIYSGPFVSQLGQRYVELYRSINLQNGEGYRRATGANLWGTPRQIRFGVRFEV